MKFLTSKFMTILLLSFIALFVVIAALSKIFSKEDSKNTNGTETTKEITSGEQK